MPTPMKKMPGMTFHEALRATMAYTPHAIQTRPRTRRNTGLDGRFPGWPCSIAVGRRGVVRPPFFLRALATRGTLVV